MKREKREAGLRQDNTSAATIIENSFYMLAYTVRRLLLWFPLYCRNAQARSYYYV